MNIISLRAAAAALLGLSPMASAGQAPAPPAAVSTSPSPAATAPIAAFAELPSLSEPTLSPDGTRIAARIVGNGQERLAVWTLSEGPEQTPHIVSIPSLSSYQWAGNGRLLVSVTSITFLIGYSIIPVPTQRVVSYDLASGKTQALGSGAGLVDSVIFVDPEGRYVLLQSQRTVRATPGVYRVELADGRSTLVQPSQRGVWTWFADGDGVVRVGVDYGERRTKIYYRDAPGAELRRVSVTRDLGDDSVVDMIRFLGGSGRGIIVTNAATGRFGVYRYDFTTDTRGEAIFEHPEVDVTAVAIGPDGAVQGVTYEDDRPRTRWFDPEMARVQQAIDRTFPGKTNMIVDRTRDGNRLLVFSGAADDPGLYYVYDRAARRMERFDGPYTGLGGISFAPVRPISYQGRDGQRINGYLTLPPGRPERGLPLILLPHGGPFERDRWQFDQEVQFLASRGYAVFQPNFRGSTGYGRAFVSRGYGQYGSGMIDDMEDGVDWLVQQGIADRGRVCIMGSSYGGYAAVWASIRSPQRYRCAVSFAGPSDLGEMIRYNTSSFTPRRYVRQIRDLIQGEERINLDSISPRRHAERMRTPLLIGHGERDTTVPPDHSHRLVAELARHNVPVDPYFYPEAGHGFTVAAERADWLQRIETFLARHNPAVVPSRD